LADGLGVAQGCSGHVAQSDPADPRESGFAPSHADGTGAIGSADKSIVYADDPHPAAKGQCAAAQGDFKADEKAPQTDRGACPQSSGIIAGVLGAVGIGWLYCS